MKGCNSILVVEDDEDIRASVMDLLETEGYLTYGASNGKEALELLQDLPKPCLVFLDMMMPIMNGREFLNRFMNDAYLAPIPVVVVSAIADTIDTQGAADVVKKPIDIDVILDIAQRFCQQDEIPKGLGDSAQSHPSL